MSINLSNFHWLVSVAGSARPPANFMPSWGSSQAKEWRKNWRMEQIGRTEVAWSSFRMIVMMVWLLRWRHQWTLLCLQPWWFRLGHDLEVGVYSITLRYQSSIHGLFIYFCFCFQPLFSHWLYFAFLFILWFNWGSNDEKFTSSATHDGSGLSPRSRVEGRNKVGNL